ncbi:MAG: hypothetical protein ACLFUB_09765 [Cyclobacteriaceae bacterium]
MLKILPLVLLLCLTSCQLRIQDQNRENYSGRSSSARAEEKVAPVPDLLPSLSEIRKGSYAMRVDGNASTFVKGNYRGKASFTYTNRLVFDNASQLQGKIRGEVELLYTMGPIRTFKVFFSEFPPVSRRFEITSYEDFANNLPIDTVSATFTIASGSQYSVRKGSLEITHSDEEEIHANLEVDMLSDKGDSIRVEVVFKALEI